MENKKESLIQFGEYILILIVIAIQIQIVMLLKDIIELLSNLAL